MIELVVFDMAGTTVDEDNVVYKTVRAAINAAGYDFTQDQVQADGAGKEKSTAIRDVLSLDGNPHTDEEVFAVLRERGVNVVLNTGYDRATATGLVGKIGWTIGKEIDGLVTASDVEIGRPGPEMIHRAMELTGVRAAACVAKIGDSQIDIEEGKNAECGMTAGITTGAQTRQQLDEANPTHIIDHLRDLLPLL